MCNKIAALRDNKSLWERHSTQCTEEIPRLSEPLEKTSVAAIVRFMALLTVTTCNVGMGEEPHLS